MTNDELISLREFFERIVDERDKQYDARFRAAEVAVNAAFAAQKELTSASFSASEKAISKAEEAQRAYNSVHNDLSRKMEVQAEKMMLRVEVEKALDMIRDDIKSLRESRSESSGEKTGTRDVWGFILAALGITVALLVGIISLVLQFIK